ncbi:UDP-glucose dehydrogenase family protein [Nocardioides jiangxiensis]|uniref:UDP-glucose 6-dehydrogenase n=1 Tax=Nocardioides jiangxiensis TaxID=3064524 RepID=A0ABT9B140_9ACTN|nr:UDP-glucose/GDP-mannose dehydrogenase family protein [Nocardioides sp. WY-20]MDO7868565.1 UDP-glucose/GDP-mannose dehydrogenase family protein [Nocardioides sp. WY-20]
MKITVIGCGYLGATHAACLAELGFDVLGVEIDERKLDALAKGDLPFYEPGLDTLLVKQVESGKLRFTSSMKEAAEFGDAHFLCVGTPQRKDGNGADLTYVDGAIESLAEHLTRPTLVIGKSTVPVGTAERLLGILQDKAPAGTDVDLAWNPEFLREGFAVEDTLTPDRLVLGVRNAEAEATLREIYATPIAGGTPVIVTDFPTAELVKVAANSFLATKISFINAMAELCEATGADVVTLADAIGHDARIGRRFLNAGVGFGGGCLPKDIRAFMDRADELGVKDALRFLREIDRINLRRRKRVVKLAKAELGDLEGKRIAVLGAAFKPDSDDIRDSPALDVAVALHAKGADVVVHDPKATGPASAKHPQLSYTESVEEAARGAQLVLHLTEWKEYRALSAAELGDLVAERTIIDGRNCLDQAAYRDAGWTIRSLGRP